MFVRTLCVIDDLRSTSVQAHVKFSNHLYIIYIYIWFENLAWACTLVPYVNHHSRKEFSQTSISSDKLLRGNANQYVAVLLIKSFLPHGMRALFSRKVAGFRHPSSVHHSKSLDIDLPDVVPTLTTRDHWRRVWNGCIGRATPSVADRIYAQRLPGARF